MSGKLIDHINKFTGSDSLLVYTQNRGLVRLYCPFTVKVIQAVDSFVVGEQLEVVNVKVSPDLDLVYIIGNTGYYHYHFSIQV